jgi:hypothetical protein
MSLAIGRANSLEKSGNQEDYAIYNQYMSNRKLTLRFSVRGNYLNNILIIYNIL